MFDRLWCFHDAVPRTGPLNMALDEAMLEFAAAGGEPVLRTYRWSEPCVSMGYFDRHAVVTARFPGRELVRRWTGGGAVDHCADFTFALAIPGQCELARHPAARRYREIHTTISRALGRCGVATEIATGAEFPPGVAGPAACFDYPVGGDLLSGSRKIVGGAQRRTRHGVLHQGSIQLPVWPVAWFAMGENLATALAREILPGGPGVEPIERAQTLAEVKYATPGWLLAR